MRKCTPSNPANIPRPAADARKVHKYKKLAAQYAVPLVVAVGAHRFTVVTLEHLDDVLTGLPAPKMTFQFNADDPFIGAQTVNMGPYRPGIGLAT